MNFICHEQNKWISSHVGIKNIESKPLKKGFRSEHFNKHLIQPKKKHVQSSGVTQKMEKMQRNTRSCSSCTTICFESRGFSGGGIFFCPFSFPRIIYVHSLESTRAKGQQQQPQQQQKQQQLQASFSFTSVKTLPTYRSGAAALTTTGGEDESITTRVETDSPSIGLQGRWKQFGSSQ